MYSASKYVAEILLGQYASFFDTLALRFFGVYGPGQKNKMIPDMIERIRNDREITLAAGKGLTINPIYIDDVINAVIALVREDACGIFNVAGTEIMSYKEMSSVVASALQVHPKYKNTSENPISLIADIKALNKYYSPKHTFSDSIPGLVASEQ